MSYVKGIDVASYQDDQYPTKGLGFVFVKATQGVNYTNPDMAKQIAAAEKAKLVVGVYHFLQPGDSVSAQVNYFKSRNVVKPGYLVAVDWESLAGAWASNTDKDAFIKALKAAYPKNRVGLYTNKDGWFNHDHTSYCGDFLWIASPTTTPGNVGIQHAWTFHQYGTTTVKNPDGTTKYHLDQDVANFQTIDALKKWAGYPATVPPVTRTAEYVALMLNDVFPVGGDRLTLEQVVAEILENSRNTARDAAETLKLIKEAVKAPQEP